MYLQKTFNFFIKHGSNVRLVKNIGAFMIVQTATQILIALSNRLMLLSSETILKEGV